MIPSPIHEEHVARAAKLVDEAGREAVRSFGNVGGEVMSARRAAAAFDLSSRGEIRVAGRDAEAFVHNLTTVDAKRLALHQGRLGLALDPKGKVVAEVFVLRDEEGFLLDVESYRTAELLAWLERYIITEDVTLEDRTSARALISVQGPKAGAVLRALSLETPAPIKAQPAVATVAKDSLVPRPLTLCASRLRMAGAEGHIVARDRTGSGGYDVRVAAGEARTVWKAILAQAGVAPAGTEALEELRVEAGLPRDGRDFGHDTIPQEAGLLGHLDFDKGCYLGQEVVARLHYRGHTNRALVGIALAEQELTDDTCDELAVPERGAAVKLIDKEIGHVTSAIFSTSLDGPIALAMIRREHAAPGTQLRVTLPAAKTATARVVDLPFVR